MRHWVFICCFIALLAGCTGNSQPELESPCVGAEDSPCGPRRPVNDWWLA